MLTNVQVNSNTGAGNVNGTWLDNNDGAVASDVSITNSSFNDNKNIGLTVNSDGMITLAGVLVNGNDAGGAYLNNSSAVTAKTVTIITGTNEFSDNLVGDGLNIASKGAITLKDITADGNGYDGAHLDNTFGTLGVTLTGTNVFSENLAEGLEINSNGAIKASSLVANVNAGWGVLLNNSTAGTAMAVTLTGSSQFKFNGTGLQVLSVGAITLNNVSASSNLSYGASLDNIGSAAASNVTLSGTSTFNGNSTDGLLINSLGVILLSNITADDNGLSLTGWGAILDNVNIAAPKAVTLSGTNSFSGNINGGLSISSSGAITASNLTASDNQSEPGAYLDNFTAGSDSVPQNVTLSGYAQINNNDGTNILGLQVITYGAITLTNVTANGNGSDGASLDNDGGNLPKAVTLNGTNTFDDNVLNGLTVYSLGAITLNNTTATGNDQNGVYLDNDAAGAVGGITLNSTGGFFNSAGLVDLTKVTADDNGGDGIGGVTDGNIIVTCGSMTSNTSSGWDLTSNLGTVTLKSVYGYGNGNANLSSAPTVIVRTCPLP